MRSSPVDYIVVVVVVNAPLRSALPPDKPVGARLRLAGFTFEQSQSFSLSYWYNGASTRPSFFIAVSPRNLLKSVSDVIGTVNLL